MLVFFEDSHSSATSMEICRWDVSNYLAEHKPILKKIIKIPTDPVLFSHSRQVANFLKRSFIFSVPNHRFHLQNNQIALFPYITFVPKIDMELSKTGISLYRAG